MATQKNPELEPDYYGCEKTPCAIQFRRSAKFIARIEHEGYEPAEIFISSQTKQGSFAGSAAATTVVMGGTTYLGAAATAGFMTFTSQLATGLAHVMTLGLSSPVSAAPVTTTSSVLSAAAPPALAVTGGMLLVDAASGANKNLYPNPVVIGLVAKGSPTKVDPFVNIYKNELEALKRVKRHCDGRSNLERNSTNDCPDARDDVQKYRKERKDAMDEIFKAQRQAYKDHKNAQKAAEDSQAPEASSKN